MPFRRGWPGLLMICLVPGVGPAESRLGSGAASRALREGPLVPSLLGWHWPLLPHPQECVASVRAAHQMPRGSSPEPVPGCGAGLRRKSRSS